MEDIETHHLIIQFCNEFSSLDNACKEVQAVFINCLFETPELTKEKIKRSCVSLKNTNLNNKEVYRVFKSINKLFKETIGYILLKEKSNEYKEVEISYYFIEEYKNQNYEIEAIKAIIWFVFEKIHKDLVSILIDINNIETHRLVREIGFVYVGKKNVGCEGIKRSFDLFHLYRIDSLDGPDWDLKKMYLCQPEEMGNFFKRRAESYNGHVMLGTRKKQYELLGKYLPKIKKSIYILDIGCGTGVELQYIWNKIPNAYITCLDLSQDMLTILLKNYELYHDKITIVNASYLDWEYPSEKYDIIVSSQTMHHFLEQQKMEVYQNIKESLKHEGMYIENDFYMDEAGSRQYMQRYKMIMSSLPPNTTTGTYHIDIPFTIEKQIEILNNVGFHSVEVLEQHIRSRGSGGIIRAIK